MKLLDCFEKLPLVERSLLLGALQHLAQLGLSLATQEASLLSQMVSNDQMEGCQRVVTFFGSCRRIEFLVNQLGRLTRIGTALEQESVEPVLWSSEKRASFLQCAKTASGALADLGWASR